MIGFILGAIVGYLLARNQDAILALLGKAKAAEQDLLPPKDPPPRP